jgi:flavin reductase (DIM6/NTAB) family NADH-FMN oxidoreductase RutF
LPSEASYLGNLVANELASLFRRLTAGVYVVGVAQEERRNAFTAAWVVQVSFKPLLLGLSINPERSSYPLLMEARVFSVNMLRRGKIDLARHFGTPSLVRMTSFQASVARGFGVYLGTLA